MKIAFLIMAHKDPAQIHRLVTRLYHPDFDFFIHLDGKINKTEFDYIQKENVVFTKTRIKVKWASFSFTKAISKCMEEILQNHTPYDFIHVFSGQDYPIQSTANIHRYFSEHRENNFISYENEGSDWWKHAIGRISNYHFTNYNFPGRYRIQFLLNKIMPKRKFPLPYVLYGSPKASWFTMNRECASYVVNFMNYNPEISRFCNFTWGSDEFLFQTIIMNSKFAPSVINDVINYIDWSGGGSNPKILTKDDFQALRDSGNFFARKFDIKVDTEILDMLDNEMAPELDLQHPKQL